MTTTTDTHERIMRLLAQARDRETQARHYLQRVWTDSTHIAHAELDQVRGPLPGSGAPLRRVEAACRARGIDFRILNECDWDGNAASAGYYEGTPLRRRIRLRSGFSIPSTAHVAVHEFTHALDENAQGPFSWLDSQSGVMNYLEVVAEGTAALVSTDYGLDPLAHSVSYIANHIVRLQDRTGVSRAAAALAAAPWRITALYARVSQTLGEVEDGIARAA
jgi:hypothetical protein